MVAYDAFISYSHAKDKPIAAALQSTIQKLGKPWYRRRALRLFRDNSSLTATPHLWPTIEQALEQSRFFLLLASPEAAASKWVQREVAYWLKHRSIDTFLIGLTDGELAWDEAGEDFVAGSTAPLPTVLAKQFPSEPKWVDLRPYRDRADKHDAKFTEFAADFAAAIRGVPKEDLLSQEVRQQRRALTLAWSAAASLLVLAAAATVAGIVAYRAQQEAVAERNRAEQTLAAATDTANSLVMDLAHRFRDAIGVPASLVKDILDRARALQDQLIASGEVTPDLKLSRAAALNEMVDTLLAIGDTDGALAAAEQGRQIIADLLALQPGETKLQRNLSVSYAKLGDVHAAQGDLAEALKSYQASLALAERLAQSDPGDATWQYELGISNERVGNVMMERGDLEGALKSYRAKQEIIARLNQSDPGKIDWQRDLSVADDKIGNVLFLQGDLAGALKSYSDDLAIAKRVAQSDPGNAVRQRDLSVAYEKVGYVQQAQNDPAEAMKSYRQSLAIRQRLVQSDPGNSDWQRDLSVALNKIGDVQAAQDDYAGAVKSYQGSLAIRERLAASDPDNSDWQRDVSVSLTRIGDMQVKQDDLAGAVKSYRDSLAIIDRLAQADPSNAAWQRDLAIGDERLGDTYELNDQTVEAKAAFERALAIYTGLLALHPDNTSILANSTVPLIRLGQLNGDQGLPYFQRALQILKQLDEAGRLEPRRKPGIAWLTQQIATLSKAN